ncbi:FH2 domain-containing protein formin 3 isoform X1 [Rhynchophorus ferrugineus]|uniref:FH2 domain-containing protein formin 3 isoform X1 n=2 Tax=Rhynchophorus ferrugineus TaxID=354439 RepID=UPI003FCCEC4F
MLVKVVRSKSCAPYLRMETETQQARDGLDFIVEHPEYVRKLAAALDAPGSSAVRVRKQMFELLAALCAHNEEGRTRALETLEHYKKIKGERYRLTFVVQELDRATAVDYQTALVAFINCLIISTPRLVDRIRLRNEFIGCHLLPVLNNLRKCSEAEPELAVQLDVFDEQRESDEAQSLQGSHGVDLNSPLDIFYAILKQVTDTPQEIPFISILQHLLRIDPKEPISDIIWDTAEKLVHKATLLERRDDVPKLLRTPSVQSRLFCHCQHKNDTSPGSRKQSLTSNTPLSPTFVAPPPPPGLPPPPPPPPNIPPAPPQLQLSVPLAKNKIVQNQSQSSSSTENPTVIEKLPQQEIPIPKTKMKTINWNKIPSNKIVGKNNIWTQVAFRHQRSPVADMDWSEMEGLFCQQAPPSANSSPKLGNRDGSDDRRVRKEVQEITLLDGKRSLNINIFLKQFRSSNEDIIELIKNGEHDEIGTEKLKGLLKILPEVDELDMLKSFNGDFSKLGNAEKFLIQLTNLSNYKLRIESMLLKEEFASNMSYLEPSISSMISAAQDLMTNKPLQEVLYMILVAGNFLNSGGYAGDAAGVKLSSLQKITDIRANKPNMNLIHFVALQAEKKNKKLLSFTDNINVLEDAAKTTVEQLHNEINALDVRIKKINKQIDIPSTEPEIKGQMTEFLVMAQNEVSSLQRELKKLDNVRKQLSEFFCEDANSFKIEECFRVFHGFYSKFKQAITENERRRLQEEQANARRKQREELLATKRKQMESLGAADAEGPFIDMQIYDTRSSFNKKGRKFTNSLGTSEDELSITSSPSMSRKRLDSFNGGNSESKEEKSPDITPNGSLRRRRSRVLSEEDEGSLMDFLRASGHDSNRERKSWGSLDRSWARKARGSGPRKRPALLGADFSSDRERPSSPSPLAENKTICSAPEDETRSKDWKLKIESWLQANETTQSSDDQRRQTRRLTTRKSVEDSESERGGGLDTLPEGRQVYSGSQSTYRKTNPSWKPSSTLDNMDIVGAIETVEEVQPQVKDKSAWRKSTLNVANSTEETKEDKVRGRHTLPRIDRSTYVQPIKEDSNRKNLINSLAERPAADKLTLYIRKPTETVDSPTQETKSNLANVSSKIRESQQSIDSSSVSSNKVEIDQDNIETPPAVRKVYIPTPVEKRDPVPPSPCKRMLDIENTAFGDGQFDRFSAARRTRRYKRNTDTNETPSPTIDSPPEVKSPSGELVKPSNDSGDEQKEGRLKAWQEKLKTPVTPEPLRSSSRRTRNQTGVCPSDVQMALRITGGNSSVDELKDFIPPTGLKVESSKIDIPRKGREHDKDEGFEESQSLMSESPSQGASSGGGIYEHDIPDTSDMAPFKPFRLENTEFVVKKEPVTKSKTIQARSTEPKSNLKRSSSVREPVKKAPLVPRRSDSIRQSDRTPNKNAPIQKSNSRNSIASSRSSLNSSTSINTVKRLPIKPSGVLQATPSRVIQRTTNSKAISSNTPVPKPPLKRSPSSSSSNGSKPPRPQGMSFMKPTTSSTTKAAPVPTKRGSSFRSKMP